MFIITWTNSLGFFYQYLKLKLNATLTKKPKFLKIIMRRTYKQSCIKWIATYWHIGGVFFLRCSGSEWASLPPEHDHILSSVSDQEFIMAFRDVIAYMEYVCVCSMTPVVDQENNNKPVHLSKLCF